MKITVLILILCTMDIFEQVNLHRTPNKAGGFHHFHSNGNRRFFHDSLHGSHHGHNPSFHASRKHSKRPFIHVGFLPDGSPLNQQGSATNILNDNNIHSEIHDINNRSLDTHAYHEFRYEGPLGPKFWPELFLSCNGIHQSPIAINRLNTVHVNLGSFKFRNYYAVPNNGVITNNGHTAMVTLRDGATISGASLPGKYEFMNFHFHWGSSDYLGSEHALDGVSYPLELHMVHWNLKYKSADEAMLYTDGFAVLAVLFHIEPLDNPYLAPIIDALKGVIPRNTNLTFTPNFRLSDFLPADTRDFYRYEGSLTTPECRESVIWTIFANTLPISEGQISVFRKLLDVDNVNLEMNHRPVQPLNDRIVYQNSAS